MNGTEELSAVVTGQKTIEHGGYISKLVFNNGYSEDIEKNSIVIFVGPNNVGKSQSLKDIHGLCESKKSTVVVKDIVINKYDEDNIEEYISSVSQTEEQGQQTKYRGLGYDISSAWLTNYKRSNYFGNLRPVFVAYLTTLERLKICAPAKAIPRDSIMSHPIHYVAFNKECRKWISSNFKKAFGEELIPHTQNVANIPLCIGNAVKFEDDYEDEQDRTEAYAKVLDSYKQVQNQGDGIKSFTGILLYLMLKQYPIFLIDEPESFLHPPQAYIMGRIIGESLNNNQQAFISTHSENIIKGLMDICPERLKIIRVTREKDENSFSILESDNLKQIWEDSLLKYSNIMTSLFHKEVVLCESDSDCKMYSIVDDYLNKEKGSYSESLFIHCNGKDRMPKISNALKALGVSVKLIPDLDVLKDETVFRGIVEAFGIEWESVKRDYKVVVSNLQSNKSQIDRKKFKSSVEDILKGATDTNLSAKEIEEIKSLLRTETKWERLKRDGTSALPAGDATCAFDNLNKTLKKSGIFIVTVGELECFVKRVGGHGPGWVNRVLEEYPDLNNEVYEDIKKFMKQVNEPLASISDGIKSEDAII